MILLHILTIKSECYCKMRNKPYRTLILMTSFQGMTSIYRRHISRDATQLYFCMMSFLIFCTTSFFSMCGVRNQFTNNFMHSLRRLKDVILKYIILFPLNIINNCTHDFGKFVSVYNRTWYHVCL